MPLGVAGPGRPAGGRAALAAAVYAICPSTGHIPPQFPNPPHLPGLARRDPSLLPWGAHSRPTSSAPHPPRTHTPATHPPWPAWSGAWPRGSRGAPAPRRSPCLGRSAAGAAGQQRVSRSGKGAVCSNLHLQLWAWRMGEREREERTRGRRGGWRGQSGGTEARAVPQLETPRGRLGTAPGGIVARAGVTLAPSSYIAALGWGHAACNQ